MILDHDKTLMDNSQARTRPTTTTLSSSALAHYRGVKSLEFLPDNSYLLTLGGDNVMHLWNVNNGQRLLVNYGPISTDNLNIITMTCAQMKHDRTKSLVYVPCGRSICVYDILTGERLTILNGHLRPVSSCIYNRLSVELYSCSDDILVWAAIKKQQDDYDRLMKNHEQKYETRKTLGQILNRDQWSDDDEDEF